MDFLRAKGTLEREPNRSLKKLEFQRTHTLCTLSMHFQQSFARAAITALQLLVTAPEIPSAAYMYIYNFAVVAQELKV